MEAQIESFTNHLGAWWWAIALLLVMSVFLLKDVVWKRTHSKSGTTATGYKKPFKLSIMGHAIVFLATVVLSFFVFDFGSDWGLKKAWVAAGMFLAGMATWGLGWQKHENTNHSTDSIVWIGAGAAGVHWALAIATLYSW